MYAIEKIFYIYESEFERRFCIQIHHNTEFKAIKFPSGVSDVVSSSGCGSCQPGKIIREKTLKMNISQFLIKESTD